MAAGIPLRGPSGPALEVALSLQQIANGDTDVIVAGGMNRCPWPHCVAHMRNGTKMGSLEILDSMLRGGLTDAFHGYHMGVTAENIAQRGGSRARQVTFAASRRTRPSRQRPAASRMRSFQSCVRRSYQRGATSSPTGFHP